MLCAVAIAVTAGCAPGDPLGGKIYTATPTDETGEKPSSALSIPSPTASGTASTQSKVQEQERKVTLTKGNTEFSIGLPAGYTEEREITASKIVDVWFKYVTPEMSLTVNGDAVQIPERRSQAKLGLVQGTTHVKYVMKSLSANYQSYSLCIVPSTQSGNVEVTTREKWTAP